MKTTTSLPYAILFLVLAASAVICQTAPQPPRSSLFDAGRLLRDIETLSSDDMEGRSPALPSIQKARDYVGRRFKESGLAPLGASFEQTFEIRRRGSTETIKGVNFVGTIAGRKFPNRYMVVTAHYDHVGTREGQIYNGADDNASGAAALFAIASYFKKAQPDHSLIFVALDAEEMGLQGARHFVANLPVPKESVVLNVNMDMLSRLLLGHDDPKLGSGDWTNQSDHAAFHAAKIPFIYFGVEDHADYHKPTDDFSGIQPQFYVNAVESVIGAIRELDKAVIK